MFIILLLLLLLEYYQLICRFLHQAVVGNDPSNTCSKRSSCESSRHSNREAFRSHVFAPSETAQIAVIDTYNGAPVNMRTLDTDSTGRIQWINVLNLSIIKRTIPHSINLQKQDWALWILMAFTQLATISESYCEVCLFPILVWGNLQESPAVCLGAKPSGFPVDVSFKKIIDDFR